MVNHKEFIKQISKKTGYSQKSISEVLACAEETLIEDIKAGEEVKVLKLVSFAPYFREETNVIGFDGKKTVVPERRSIKVKISDNLRKIIR